MRTSSMAQGKEHTKNCLICGEKFSTKRHNAWNCEAHSKKKGDKTNSDIYAKKIRSE